MTARSSQVVVNAPLQVVRQILLEPSALADWNPAFLSVKAPHTAAVGQRYPVWTRGALKGFLEYRQVTGTLIAAHWEVPGFIEDHSWELRPHHNRTYVKHLFKHRGALAALLRPAFANVAELRLGRLAERAEGRAAVREV
jgi:hypothetical protein